MKIVDNASKATKMWSVRLALLSALSAVSAAIARVIKQENLHD